ncbi:MAG: 3-deoxy-manno-octulosonate cytidylyltransferase [Chitinivibrionales bacterium]|nr:3-deoxy-manno-octulosonate cytidylyltransferase [Chitinivibrionales bacterium]
MAAADGKILCVIPARYQSVRLPGKPLKKVKGIPLVMWTYSRACESQAFTGVVVATDDQRIYDSVKSSGGNVVMTSSSHQSGTDRMHEVAGFMQYEYLVNLQGDEPDTPVRMLQEVSRNLQKLDNNSLLTCVSNATIIEKNDPDVVKAVLNCRNEALYFSRAPIPFARDDTDNNVVYKHSGIYGFTCEGLERFCSFPGGRLEHCEKLEQLRALEFGMNIICCVCDSSSRGIDTAEDLEAFRARVESRVMVAKRENTK